MGSLPRPLSGLSRALSAFISCSRPAETELTNGLLFTAPGGAFHIAAWVISPLKVLDFFICCCPVFPSPAGLLASSGDLWRMNWTSLEYSPHLANTCNNNNCQQVDINQYYTTGRIFSYSSPPPVPPPPSLHLLRSIYYHLTHKWEDLYLSTTLVVHYIPQYRTENHATYHISHIPTCLLMVGFYK